MSIVTYGFGYGYDDGQFHLSGSRPTIENISPSAGSNITANTPVSFDVLDPQGFTRILIVASYSTLQLDEVVHDGTDFGPKYQGVSNTRTVVSNGYDYTILRDGGWPESFSLTPYAIDVSGSENL